MKQVVPVKKLRPERHGQGKKLRSEPGVQEQLVYATGITALYLILRLLQQNQIHMYVAGDHIPPVLAYQTSEK